MSHPEAAFLGLEIATHGKGQAWWIGYFIANWLTAAAYFAIPLRMAWQRHRGERRAESFLFEMFVSACGVHHLFMPPGMLFGFLDALIYVDFAMAAVSVIAAFELTRSEPFERRGDDG